MRCLGQIQSSNHVSERLIYWLIPLNHGATRSLIQMIVGMMESIEEIRQAASCSRPLPTQCRRASPTSQTTMRRCRSGGEGRGCRRGPRMPWSFKFYNVSELRKVVPGSSYSSSLPRYCNIQLVQKTFANSERVK